MSFRSNKTNVRTKRSCDRVRFLLVQVSFTLVFVLLAGRLVYVQAFLSPDLTKKANLQQASKSLLEAPRYPIVDRSGRVLAETVPVSSCFVDPTKVKDPVHTSKMLAHELNLDAAALLRQIRGSTRRFLWVKRNVPVSQMEAIKKRALEGVGFQSEFRRHYPEGELAPHLLGLVGVEGMGLSGVERSFDKNLMTEKGASSVHAGPVQLTIDARVQKVVERELDWGARKTGAKRGLAIVQNPKTGEMLAMAAWPPLSLDADNPPPSTEMRVPALVDVFEPGSTFKIVAASAGLEEKVISPDTVFSGENGAWSVYDITIHDHEKMKRMTIEEVMVHSSNIGTAKIADRLGSERLYQYSRLFGFGVMAGTGLSGEARGVLREPSKWSGVSKYVISFGQEVSVTAVQMVGAFSAIANKGVLMEPHLVRHILNEKGESVWENKPAPVRRVLSEPTAQQMTRFLTAVVEKGTGVNAQVRWDPSMKVAGKTGTAQKYDTAKRKYCDVLALVSFCGFFPADNPQYTMIVILDEPEGRRWGGLDAAPVFRRIAEQLTPEIHEQKYS